MEQPATETALFLLGCAVGEAYSLYFDNIQNPPSQININLPVTIETWTGQGWAIE